MKRIYVLLIVGLLLAGCGTAPTRGVAPAPKVAAQEGVVLYRAQQVGNTHAYTAAPPSPPPSPGRGGSGSGRGSYDAYTGPVAEEVRAGRKAEAPRTGESGAPTTDPADTRRIMIYTGQMSLVVDNIQTAIETVRKEAEKVGGYIQGMDAQSIVVKVPAPKFLEVIAAVEKLGEVTQKEVKGSDVTEEMRDLQIRLKNAEEVRNRLVTLLQRVESVDDALKIELQLERVTVNIELLKGKIKALENQVEFSTLTVYLNSPLPQRIIKEEVPFPWVTELAGDMAKGTVIEMPTRTGGKHVVFDLPKSFAKYHEANYVTRATSADGVFIKVERHPNVEGGDLAFWSKLIRRALTAKQAIVVKQERDTTISDDVAAKIIEGGKEISGAEYTYLVAVAETEDFVYTYEAWGPNKEFANAKESLEKSIRSMNVLTFWGSLFR